METKDKQFIKEQIRDLWKELRDLVLIVENLQNEVIRQEEAHEKN